MRRPRTRLPRPVSTSARKSSKKRIDQGVQSGELSKRETTRLERHQTGIDKMEDKAKADGTVTKKERAHLHHAQNNESQRIHRQKHDRQNAK